MLCAIRFQRAFALGLACAALFAFSPRTELKAGPGTVLSKAGKLGKGGKSTKVGRTRSSDRVGFSAAGTVSSAVRDPAIYAGNTYSMSRALARRPSAGRKPRTAKNFSELSDLGFDGVAGFMQRTSAPPGSKQLYIGRLDGDFYFVSTKGSEFVYGKLRDSSPDGVKALLGEAAETGRAHLIVEPEVLDERLISANLLKTGLDIRVVRDAQRTWATRVINNEERELAVIYSRTLHVKVSNQALIADLRHLDGRSFSKSDVRILSHFDETADLDSVRRLQEVGKSRNVGVANVNQETIAREFEEHSGKTITMVGHVENNAFVAYAADGTVVSRIPLERIQDLANRNHNHVLFLGCSTARSPGAAGYLRKVQSFEVAGRLHRALRMRYLGDFYSALGTRNNPMVVTELAIAREGTDVVGVRLVGSAVLRGQANGLQVGSGIPNVLWMLPYVLGAAVSFWTICGIYLGGRYSYRWIQSRRTRHKLAQT